MYIAQANAVVVILMLRTSFEEIMMSFSAYTALPVVLLHTGTTVYIVRKPSYSSSVPVLISTAAM